MITIAKCLLSAWHCVESVTCINSFSSHLNSTSGFCYQLRFAGEEAGAQREGTRPGFLGSKAAEPRTEHEPRVPRVHAYPWAVRSVDDSGDPPWHPESSRSLLARLTYAGTTSFICAPPVNHHGVRQLSEQVRLNWMNGSPSYLISVWGTSLVVQWLS